ncbi:MAG: DUF2096 family protein [Candidatus Bathyarchaeia archaeon]
MLHDHGIIDYFPYDKLITKSALFVLQGAFMSWEARWKILSDVITDLCRRGERVPPNIINDLRSAKIMLEVVKADRIRSENVARLEEYLSNVESYILPAARNVFGEDYVNNILRRLCELEAEGFMLEEFPRFRPGLPREEKWVRVQVTEITPLEFIREVAGEFNLKLRVEDDGYALVYGAEESVKAFIKRLSERTRGSKVGYSKSA